MPRAAHTDGPSHQAAPTRHTWRTYRTLPNKLIFVSSARGACPTHRRDSRVSERSCRASSRTCPRCSKNRRNNRARTRGGPDCSRCTPHEANRHVVAASGHAAAARVDRPQEEHPSTPTACTDVVPPPAVACHRSPRGGATFTSTSAQSAGSGRRPGAPGCRRSGSHRVHAPVRASKSRHGTRG